MSLTEGARKVIREGKVEVQIVNGLRTKVTETQDYLESNKEKVRKNFGLDMGQSDIKLTYSEDVKKGTRTIKELKHDVTPSKIDVDCINKFGKTDIINGVNCVISTDSNYSIKHTKNTEHNIFLGYYLLAEHLEDGDIINVGIGLPIDVFKNMEERKKFAENFRNNGNPIKVNDKTFYIDHVRVCAEGVSAILGHEAERDTLVIDIGGRNINMVIVDSLGRPIVESTETLDIGMHRVVSDLRSEIRSIGEIVTDDNVRYFISKGCKDERISETINRYIFDYIQKINQAIKRRQGFGFNKNTTDILFVGGTSKQFEKEIVDYLGDEYDLSVSDNAKYDNADGYYELLMADIED